MVVVNSSVKKPVGKYATISIAVVGVCCMVVAGYFLIEGLLQFGGSSAAKRMLIIAGILFQITESLCFISSAALTSHSMRWRHSMFLMGLVLFGFSIAVMTFAQKAALETGEAAAAAIDERRNNIREQIDSLDELIASYRLNAEKQSKSIYAKSRLLGQESINKATELAEKKMELSDQLYKLNESRRQTSIDFFEKLEQVTGMDALQTEFWFLFLRSLLLELCGIMLMSFGAHLYTEFHASHGSQLVTTGNSSKDKTTQNNKNGQPGKHTLLETIEGIPEKLKRNIFGRQDTAARRTNLYKRLKESAEGGAPVTDLLDQADKVARLYENGKLKTLGREAIRTALLQHHGIQIGSQKASQLSDIVQDYVNG